MPVPHVERRRLATAEGNLGLPDPNPAEDLRKIIGPDGFTEITEGDIKIRVCDWEHFKDLQAAVPPYPVSLYPLYILVGSPDTDLDPRKKNYTEALVISGDSYDRYFNLYIKKGEKGRFSPDERIYHHITTDQISMEGYVLWKVVRENPESTNFTQRMVNKALEMNKRTTSSAAE